MSTLIFQHSQPGRIAITQSPQTAADISDIPAHLQRETALDLPEVSELDAVRHYTNLSRKNFSIDTQFYPLGSCTMKYNPRAVHKCASSERFLSRHPLTDAKQSQGFLQCMYELQNYLCNITGMAGVSLTSMAGAQGEFAGVAMIRAYHMARGDHARQEIIIPDAAHGTNPASAVMCGYKVREIATLPNGDVDLDALQQAVGPQTAGIMLTNPSTLGIFERRIREIAQLIHRVGGLLYYDGANLNAILGKTRPGDMGFDVLHLNLHKTFATPHGGGGPGAGPVAASQRLLDYLPTPIVAKQDKQYFWLTQKDCPQSIGRLSAFMGNAGILMRAYYYIRLLGNKGLSQVAELATLNANYLMAKLRDIGYEVAYPERRATHEFIITLRQEAKSHGITAMDVAKRLLDEGIHAPTTYFPLLVPECLLIEPTETESKQTLDHFVDVMAMIREEILDDPAKVKQAPLTQPVKRLDDVKAVRELDIVWQENQHVTVTSLVP